MKKNTIFYSLYTSQLVIVTLLGGYNHVTRSHVTGYTRRLYYMSTMVEQAVTNFLVMLVFVRNDFILNCYQFLTKKVIFLSNKNSFLKNIFLKLLAIFLNGSFKIFKT